MIRPSTPLWCASLLAFAFVLVPGCQEKKGTPKPPAPVTRGAPGAAGDGAPAPGGGAGAAGAGGAAHGGAGAAARGGAERAGDAGAAGRPGATQTGGFRTSGPQDDPTMVEVGGLSMRKPALWVWTAPTMQFRALQYAVPAVGTEAPAAELVFSVFPAGDGGPVDANLDRWAGQFLNAEGNAPAPSQRARVEVAGMPISRIESKGSYMGMGQAAPRPGQMQLGAIVQAPGRNVFIKIVGPEATVESNRAAFDAMIASIVDRATGGGAGSEPTK
jgi:hypothetical protein